MVLESRPDLGEDGTRTTEPADGRYRYCERKIWDCSAQSGESQGIQGEEGDDDDGDYYQDRGSRRSGEKSSLDEVEPDDVGESVLDPDEVDESDLDPDNAGESDEDNEADEDNEVEGVSQMSEKESAARIDQVSSKL